MSNTLCQRLHLQHPIIQAPMAGVSTPELAAAVSNAGGLGSLGFGASSPEQAEAMIRKTASLTSAPFNVNVFCHQPQTSDSQQEQAWIERFRSTFASFNAEPPATLPEIYESFLHNEAMLDVLLKTKPAVVSFHFGLPSADALQRLKAQGIVTLASATSPAEAQAIEAAGIDFVIAQGIEAGGHRGIFDPAGDDQALSTFTLVQAIRQVCRIPVIAAGGIMDGAGIRAMLDLGATAVQMGTAFLLCPEAATNAAWRDLLKSDQAASTTMTSAISGRPARCITNDFCRLTATFPQEAIPPYPQTYALGKALAAAASAQGNSGFGAQWAGQGAALIQELPAAELVAMLAQGVNESRDSVQ